MTDAQGFAIFACIAKAFFDQKKAWFDKLDSRQLEMLKKAGVFGEKSVAYDLRGYIEPTIDGMLADAKKQGIAELKEKLVEFAGSKRTIATTDLLRFLKVGE